MQIKGLSKEEIKTLENCPYGCVNGKVFVQALRSYQDCPHCAEIYTKMAEGSLNVTEDKSIFDILAIPKKYRYAEFSDETFFPETVVATTTNGSRREVLEKLNFIKKKALCGELYDEDYLFYVGMETDLFPFVFEVLKGYFRNGKTVVPFLNTVEILQLFKNFESPNSDYKPGIDLEQEICKNYWDICKSDICIVSVPPSAGSNSINMLFTLLKARRAKGKNTIVFSETQGVSRQLGYVLNNDDFVTGFIQSVKKDIEVKPKKEEKKQQPIEKAEKKNISAFNKI